MEMVLRIGQCHDSLSKLRSRLSARARLLKYKYINIRHQAQNTRSRNLLNRVTKKLEVTATKYRHALKMLGALDRCEVSEWRLEFLELRDQDVRSMSEAKLPDAPTRERAEELQARSLLNGGAVPEGNRTVSWIWRGSLKGGSAEQDGLGEYGEG
jgi:hypothetical protein